MANLYGTLRSDRSIQTIAGNNHLTATAASWMGSITTTITRDPKTANEIIKIAFEPWQGSGPAFVLFEGTWAAVDRLEGQRRGDDTQR